MVPPHPSTSQQLQGIEHCPTCLCTYAHDFHFNLIPSLTEKTFVITDVVSTDCLGYVLAKNIAQAQASRLFITAGNLEDVKKIASTLRKETGNANINALRLDFENLTSVKQSAEWLITYYQVKPDVLILNTQSPPTVYRTVENGICSQLMHHHIGPHLFLSLMFEHLPSNARVVFYTTSLIRQANIVNMLPSLIHSEKIVNDPKWLWIRANLCALLSSLAWSEFLAWKNIYTNVIEVDHPPERIEDEALGVLYASVSLDVEKLKIFGKIFAKRGINVDISIAGSNIEGFAQCLMILTTNWINERISVKNMKKWIGELEWTTSLTTRTLSSRLLLEGGDLTGKLCLLVGVETSVEFVNLATDLVERKALVVCASSDYNTSKSFAQSISSPVHSKVEYIKLDLSNDDQVKSMILTLILKRRPFDLIFINDSLLSERHLGLHKLFCFLNPALSTSAKVAFIPNNKSSQNYLDIKYSMLAFAVFFYWSKIFWSRRIECYSLILENSVYKEELLLPASSATCKLMQHALELLNLELLFLTQESVTESEMIFEYLLEWDYQSRVELSLNEITTFETLHKKTQRIIWSEECSTVVKSFLRAYENHELDLNTPYASTRRTSVADAKLTKSFKIRRHTTTFSDTYPPSLDSIRALPPSSNARDSINSDLDVVSKKLEVIQEASTSVPVSSKKKKIIKKIKRKVIIDGQVSTGFTDVTNVKKEELPKLSVITECIAPKNELKTDFFANEGEASDPQTAIPRKSTPLVLQKDNVDFSILSIEESVMADTDDLQLQELLEEINASSSVSTAFPASQISPQQLVSPRESLTRNALALEESFIKSTADITVTNSTIEDINGDETIVEEAPIPGEQTIEATKGATTSEQVGEVQEVAKEHFLYENEPIQLQEYPSIVSKDTSTEPVELYEELNDAESLDGSLKNPKFRTSDQLFTSSEYRDILNENPPCDIDEVYHEVRQGASSYEVETVEQPIIKQAVTEVEESDALEIMPVNSGDITNDNMLIIEKIVVSESLSAIPSSLTSTGPGVVLVTDNEISQANNGNISMQDKLKSEDKDHSVGIIAYDEQCIVEAKVLQNIDYVEQESRETANQVQEVILNEAGNTEINDISTSESETSLVFTKDMATLKEIPENIAQPLEESERYLSDDSDISKKTGVDHQDNTTDQKGVDTREHDCLEPMTPAQDCTQDSLAEKFSMVQIHKVDIVNPEYLEEQWVELVSGEDEIFAIERAGEISSQSQEIDSEDKDLPISNFSQDEVLENNQSKSDLDVQSCPTSEGEFIPTNSIESKAATITLTDSINVQKEEKYPQYDEYIVIEEEEVIIMEDKAKEEPTSSQHDFNQDIVSIEQQHYEGTQGDSLATERLNNIAESNEKDTQVHSATFTLVTCENSSPNISPLDEKPAAINSPDIKDTEETLESDKSIQQFEHNVENDNNNQERAFQDIIEDAEIINHEQLNVISLESESTDNAAVSDKAIVVEPEDVLPVPHHVFSILEEENIQYDELQAKECSEVVKTAESEYIIDEVVSETTSDSGLKLNDENEIECIRDENDQNTTTQYDDASDEDRGLDQQEESSLNETRKVRRIKFIRKIKETQVETPEEVSNVILEIVDQIPANNQPSAERSVGEDVKMEENCEIQHFERVELNDRNSTATLESNSIPDENLITITEKTLKKNDTKEDFCAETEKTDCNDENLAISLTGDGFNKSEYVDLHNITCGEHEVVTINEFPYCEDETSTFEIETNTLKDTPVLGNNGNILIRELGTSTVTASSHHESKITEEVEEDISEYSVTADSLITETMACEEEAHNPESINIPIISANQEIFYIDPALRIDTNDSNDPPRKAPSSVLFDTTHVIATDTVKEISSSQSPVHSITERDSLPSKSTDEIPSDVVTPSDTAAFSQTQLIITADCESDSKKSNPYQELELYINEEKQYGGYQQESIESEFFENTPKLTSAFVEATNNNDDIQDCAVDELYMPEQVENASTNIDENVPHAQVVGDSASSVENAETDQHVSLGHFEILRQITEEEPTKVTEEAKNEPKKYIKTTEDTEEIHLEEGYVKHLERTFGPTIITKTEEITEQMDDINRDFSSETPSHEEKTIDDTTYDFEADTEKTQNSSELITTTRRRIIKRGILKNAKTTEMRNLDESDDNAEMRFGESMILDVNEERNPSADEKSYVEIRRKSLIPDISAINMSASEDVEVEAGLGLSSSTSESLEEFKELNHEEPVEVESKELTEKTVYYDALSRIEGTEEVANNAEENASNENLTVLKHRTIIRVVSRGKSDVNILQSQSLEERNELIPPVVETFEDSTNSDFARNANSTIVRTSDHMADQTALRLPLERENRATTPKHVAFAEVVVERANTSFSSKKKHKKRVIRKIIRKRVVNNNDDEDDEEELQERQASESEVNEEKCSDSDSNIERTEIVTTKRNLRRMVRHTVFKQDGTMEITETSETQPIEERIVENIVIEDKKHNAISKKSTSRHILHQKSGGDSRLNSATSLGSRIGTSSGVSTQDNSVILNTTSSKTDILNLLNTTSYDEEYSNVSERGANYEPRASTAEQYSESESARKPGKKLVRKRLTRKIIKHDDGTEEIIETVENIPYSAGAGTSSGATTTADLSIATKENVNSHPPSTSSSITTIPPPSTAYSAASSVGTRLEIDDRWSQQTHTPEPPRSATQLAFDPESRVSEGETRSTVYNMQHFKVVDPMMIKFEEKPKKKPRKYSLVKLLGKMRKEKE